MKHKHYDLIIAWAKINDIYIGHPKNIKLTFDGDTGNLKAAEVIK